MTSFASSHRRPSFCAICLTGLVTLLSGCGDPPSVDVGDDDPGMEEPEPGTDEPNQPSPTNTTGQPPAHTPDPIDDPLMVDEPNEPGAGPFEPTDECAPSVFPQTQNVPITVERTVEVPVEVEIEQQVTPTVLLLLDRSLSMREGLEGTSANRWQTMADILFTGDEPLLEGLASEASLGVTHFTAARNTTGEEGSGHCVDLSVPVDQIDFRADNFVQLREQHAATTLGYGTPTGEALHAVSASFANVESEGERHIVVVTDGEPAHCNDLFDFSGETAVQLVLDAATQAHQSGITVHVIGIGPDIHQEHLQSVADAGGGVYRSALSGDSLQSAFEDVLREFDTVTVTEIETRVEKETVLQEQRSCAFAIDFGELGADAFAEAGAVSLGGEPLNYGDDNGWTIDDDDEFVLLGSACDAYLAEDDAPELAIELACPNLYVDIPR